MHTEHLETSDSGQVRRCLLLLEPTGAVAVQEGPPCRSTARRPWLGRDNWEEQMLQPCLYLLLSSVGQPEGKVAQGMPFTEVSLQGTKLGREGQRIDQRENENKQHYN